MKAFLLVLVVVLALAVLFAVQNPAPFTVNFLSLSGQASPLVVILLPFGLGLVAGLLCGIPGWARGRRRIRELEAELAERRKPSPPSPEAGR